MKRVLGPVACILLIAACGSDGGGGDTGQTPPKLDGSGFPADDPTTSTTGALSASLAQNITINQIAAYQVEEVPLAQDGKPADRTIGGTTSPTTCMTTADCPAPRECSPSGQCLYAMKIIAKRPALLRIYVTTGPGWQTTDITARVKIQFTGPTGTETRVVFNTKTVKAGASSVADLSSTINVDLPPEALEPYASFGVVLNQTGGGAATPTSAARYPMDGSLDDLAVVGGGDVMHLQLVPITIGGGPVPDTSADKLKAITDRFMQLYPIVSLDLTVHAPYASNSGGALDAALMEMNALHGKDNAPSNVYYYGIVEGAGGGLSGLGPPASVGANDPGVMTHEVGHAHGLSHAPGCGAGGIPPMYWPTDPPHTNASGAGILGRWGYDSLGKIMVDPTTTVDVMSYCQPTWISDFHYMRIYLQVRGDNKFYSYNPGPVGHDEVPPYRGLYVRPNGATVWDAQPTTQLWAERGEPQTIQVTMADGTTVSQTGYYFPYDHEPGGLLMVPDNEKALTVRAPALPGTVTVAH